MAMSPYIDIAGAFNAAQQSKLMQQQYRLAEMQQQAIEEEQRRRAELPSARRQYFSGDPRALQQLDPGAYRDLEKGRLDAEKLQYQVNQDAAKAQQERGVRTAKTLANAIDVVIKNPAMYPQMRQRLIQMSESKAIDLDPTQLPEQMPAPEELEQFRTMHLEASKEFMDRKITDDIAEVATGLGLDLRDERSWQDQRLQDAMQKRNQAKAAGGKDPTGELRKEFQGQQTVKNTQTLAEAYQKIMSTSPTGAGDMSLIFSYMKMLDPGSTVREGEYATAQSAGSVPQNIVAMYNRVLSGEKLNPDVRQQFKSEAKSIFSAQRKRYESLAGEYKRLAGKAGVDPGDVVLDPMFDIPINNGPGPSKDARPPRKDKQTGKSRFWDDDKQQWVSE